MEVAEARRRARALMGVLKHDAGAVAKRMSPEFALCIYAVKDNVIAGWYEGENSEIKSANLTGSQR